MMRQLLKKILWRTPLYDLIRQGRQQRELRIWERQVQNLSAEFQRQETGGRGRATPPPGLKQRVVREVAKRFSLRVLVETGTSFGDMIFAARTTFGEIYSIELDRRLYQRAARRFRKDNHIHIVPGDSYETLPAVLSKIADRPALFWLDAHMMGGGVRGRLVTPVAQELRMVLERELHNDVILVDDARLFTGGFDYPTLDEVRQLVTDNRPDRKLTVEHDIIHIYRRSL